MTGRFIAVVGPSGVGKDSLMSALTARDPRFVSVRRVITRPANAQGELFNPVSEAAFNDMRDLGAFALHWQAHGLSYGIPAGVDRQIARGDWVLANLSRSVLPRAQARFGRIDTLFVTTRTDVLRHRLMLRGRESARQIENRLARAGQTLPEGIEATVIDNSGRLRDTVDAALDALYRGQRA